MSIERKAAFLSFAACLGVIGVTLGLAALLQARGAVGSKQEPAISADSKRTYARLSGEAERGFNLFDRNCAHCHGENARGEEGPSLYDLRKSDARIGKIIKGGIKGEMPKFGTKFSDSDITALIAFLRTLKS